MLLMFRFLISNFFKDKSKNSTTITFGEYLLKSKFLKISNSDPSTSTDKKSIFLSL